jgi:hypothetical protein
MVTCPWSIVKMLTAAFTAAVHVSLLSGGVYNGHIHVRAALISKGLTSTAETVEVFLRASILKCVSEMIKDEIRRSMLRYDELVVMRVFKYKTTTSI